MLREITVEQNVDNKRLDKFISEMEEDLSRTTIQRLIEEEKVLVNEQKVKTSYKPISGDKIRIIVEQRPKLELKAQKIPVQIMYEDKDIVVVNKPKGMVVHPANGNYDGTLVNALLGMYEDKSDWSFSEDEENFRPGIVHRLDKDTSGLLIVAKNDVALMKMSKEIHERKVPKKYIALVKGNVPDDEATIDLPIARSTKDRKKMAVDEKGKNAVTYFKVLKRYDRYTLLELKIATGRTHQIRVHMSYIGHPVVGDEVYSNGKNEFEVKGQMLHAWKLEFIHPITGEKINLEAPVPDYFKEILEKLNDREIK